MFFEKIAFIFTINVVLMGRSIIGEGIDFQIDVVGKIANGKYITLQENELCLSFEIMFTNSSINKVAIYGHTPKLSWEVYDLLILYVKDIGFGEWHTQEIPLNKFVNMSMFAFGNGSVLFKSLKHEVKNCSSNQKIIKSNRKGNYSEMMNVLDIVGSPLPLFLIEDGCTIPLFASHVNFTQKFFWGTSMQKGIFVQGYQYYICNQSYDIVNLVLKQFTVSLWIKYELSQMFYEFNISGNYSFGLKIKNSKLLLQFNGIDINITTFGSYGWYHVINEFLSNKVNTYVNGDWKFTFYIGEVSSYIFKSLSIYSNAVCLHLYDGLLPKWFYDSLMICPNRHTSDICKDPYGCHYCDQLTGEGNYKSYDLRFKLHKCARDFNFDYFLQYFTFDSPEYLSDEKNSSFKLSLPVSSQFIYGIANSALCIENQPSYTLINDFPIKNGSTFGVWLKHFCSWGRNDFILLHERFALKCNPNIYFPIAIIDTILLNAFYIPGKSGIWYQLAITMLSPLRIYVNGRPIKVGVNSNIDFNYLNLKSNIQIGNIQEKVCFDELYVAEFADIYSVYYDQLYGSSTDLDKVQNSYYALEIQIQSLMTPNKNASMFLEMMKFYNVKSVEQQDHYTTFDADIYVEQLNDSVLKTLEDLLSESVWSVKGKDDALDNQVTEVKNISATAIEYRIMNYPLKSCDPNMNISTKDECQRAIDFVENYYSIKSKRVLQNNSWNGVPKGCSIQMGLFKSKEYQDFSAHWNTIDVSNNQRLLSGEFMMLCRTDPSWLSLTDRNNEYNMAFHKNVTFSSSQLNPFWKQVDLEKSQIICKVILNSTDANTMNSFEIRVSDYENMSSYSVCNKYSENTNALIKLEVICSICVSGRFVRYLMLLPGILVVDMEVYGVNPGCYSDVIKEIVLVSFKNLTSSIHSKNNILQLQRSDNPEVFYFVKGLDGSNTKVSIKSMNGLFITNIGKNLFLMKCNSSQAKQVSFIHHQDKWYSGFSAFESFDFPGYYIFLQGVNLTLSLIDETNQEHWEAASFKTQKKFKYEYISNYLVSEKINTASTYKINKNYIQWIEEPVVGHPTLSLKVRILSMDGDIVVDEFEAMSTDFINLASLAPYTSYIPCFKVSTAQENLNVYGKFNCNFSSFTTPEAEPLQAPKILHCSVKNSVSCRIVCIFQSINSASWQGKPFGYKVYWSGKPFIGNIESDVSQWSLNNFLQVTISYKENLTFYNVDLDVDKLYSNTCIVIMATTSIGQLNGPRTIKCLRSCEGAPEGIPTNITASLKLDIRTIQWNALPNNSDIWNVADLSICRYHVEIFSAIGVIRTKNWDYQVKENMTYETADCFLPLNDSKFNSNSIHFVTVAAISIEKGSPSPLYCWLIKPSRPTVAPNILNVSSKEPTILSLKISPINLLEWRGEKYILLQVTYASRLLPASFEWGKNLSVSYKYDVEVYQNFSVCQLSFVQSFFLNNSIFEEEFLWYGFFPDTVYTMSAAFCNELGCSEFSNNVTVETVKILPCLSMTTINITATSWTVNVTQNEKQCANQSIFFYNFTFLDIFAGNQTKKALLNKKLHFENLLCYRNYCVETDEIDVFGEAIKLCAQTNATMTSLTPKITEVAKTRNSYEFSLVQPDESRLCDRIKYLAVLCNALEINGSEQGLGNNITTLFPVSHEEIFNQKDKKNFKIINLTSGHWYKCQLMFVTFSGPGATSEENFYTLGINGSWSEWSTWSECSKECSGGNKTRFRTCTDPAPTVGGENCPGNFSATSTCNEHGCAYSVFGEIADGNCDQICNKVGLFCSEIISKPNQNISTCSSPPNAEERIWSKSYHPTYDLSKHVCYGYLEMPNYISCKVANVPSQQARVCNCMPKEDVGFFEWGSWSLCPTTCGFSEQMRKRECLIKECTGKLSEKRECYLPACPVDGEWGSWSNFTECSKTCSGGYQERIRACDSPKRVGAGLDCQGSSKDILGECNIEVCPVNGGESEWGQWSECDKPCGDNAYKTRRRYCNNPVPKYGGMGCLNNLNERYRCDNLMECSTMIITYAIKFADWEWQWWYYNLESENTENILHYVTYLISVALSPFPVLSFKISSFKKGSVVVIFNVTYEYINSTEIVKFVDSIYSNNLLLNESVSSVVVESISCPCSPPSNIKVTSINQTLILIQWVLPYCDIQTNWLSIMYIEHHRLGAEWKQLGMPKTPTMYLLHDLSPFTTYRAYLVPALTYGNGLPSEMFFIETPPFLPQHEPINYYAISTSSTEILVVWDDIPVEYWNGKLLGYKVKWKKYADPIFQSKEVPSPFKSSLIKGLKPFTLYHLEVNGFNVVGEGPPGYLLIKTMEGVPSDLVPDIFVNDMQSFDWWAVRWGRLSSEFSNGVLLGYCLVYYLSYYGGVEITGEKQKVQLRFDNLTFYYKAKNMLNYAVYNVTVVGFTVAGYGPGREYQAKTCNCDKNIVANWYVKKPFVEINQDNQLAGIFPKILEKTVFKACGSCKSYPQSTIQYYSSRSGLSNNKLNESSLESSIGSDTDITFPIYSKVSRYAVPNSSFVPIVRSPGILFIVRDEVNEVGILLRKLFKNIFRILPILVITYAIATLFGIIIWFIDQFANPDQFHLGSSLKGPLYGFWFSFVSMTTIGYGDIVPRSFSAKCICVAWLLIGLVLNSIIVSLTINVLTLLNKVEKLSLYNTKVAALINSLEYRFAVLRNADLGKGNGYETVESMLEALENNQVDIVLLDIYASIPYKTLIAESGFIVKELVDIGTAYGFALSGVSLSIENDIRSFLKGMQSEITNFIRSLNSNLPDMHTETSAEANSYLFSANSLIFQTTLKILLSIVVTCFVIGCTFDALRHITKIKNKKEIRSGEKIHKSLIEIDGYFLSFKRRITTLHDELIELHDKERFDLYVKKSMFSQKVAPSGKIEDD